MNSREVCERAGVSYRQLDFWARRGWIGFEGGGGTGRSREFTSVQVDHIIRMSRLVKAGMYPNKAHQIAAGEFTAVDRLVAAVQLCVRTGELVYRPLVGRPDPE